MGALLKLWPPGVSYSQANLPEPPEIPQNYHLSVFISYGCSDFCSKRADPSCGSLETLVPVILGVAVCLETSVL